MDDFNDRLIYLYDAFIANTASPEETEEFFRMINETKGEHPLKKRIFEEFGKDNTGLQTNAKDWQRSLDRILQADAGPRTLPMLHTSGRKGWMYAAAVIVVLLTAGTGYYFFSIPDTKVQEISQKTPPAKQQDLAPGRNGAMLILDDGTTISLDSADNGVLALQGNTRVMNKDGYVSYEKTGASKNEVLYNTISTPRGRQFSLILSDGSKVWLNAASSIRYPANFDGDERKVVISGEVYMEIAVGFRKNQLGEKEKIPFIVQFNAASGNKGEIQVLGTHFNVNTYGDDRDVKTTLLEGSIRMSLNNQEVMINPGQQASVDKKGRLKLYNDIDMDAVMAWKNGYFSFNNTDMYALMNEIGRWYDVDVEYAGAVPERKFGGEIARNSNASQVLKIMEESNVRFRIEEKKIIVLP